MPKLVDLTGERFGRLLVIQRAGSNKAGFATWLARCDCGTEKTLSSLNLLHSNTKSCGCWNKEIVRDLCIKRSTTHGKHHTRAYKIWAGMIQRCNNPKVKAYQFYGARGIKVCERWKSFEDFYADMGDPPTTDHSIERTHNDKNYEPGNCRWATRLEQSNNRRSNVLLTFDGTTKTLKEWSNSSGMSISALSYRVKTWGVERALSTPAP